MDSLFFSFVLLHPVVCLLLLFWYKTDFVIIYGKLFRLNKLLKIDRFEQQKFIDFDLTYQKFLALNYKNFFVKLLSCSICLTTWLVTIISLLFIISLRDINFIILIPLNILVSLLYYSIFKSL